MLSRNALLLLFSLLARAGYGQDAVPGYIVTAGQDSIRGLFSGTMSLPSKPAYTSQHDTIRYVAIGLHYPKAGAPRRVFVRQLVAGPVELLNYYYSTRLASSAAPSAAGTPVVRTTAATAAHPPLYNAQYGGRPAGELPVFPPLSAASARRGGGNSLLLRRQAQNSLTEITWWNFPADAAAYFADSPALATDLHQKHYRARDIVQVVRRYNRRPGPAAPAK